MKVHGVRYESPEAGALTLFGLLPEPEMPVDPAAAWLAALERKAGAVVAARARKLRAAKLPVAA